jgi:alkylated DNA nucleotide flippase Atl1
MVPDYLVNRWESAYSAYRTASEMVNASTPGDCAAAEHMAQASRAVATAWRDIAVESELSWWSVAAVTTAAQAFDHQAQDWAARAKHGRESTSAEDRRKRRAVYPVAGRGGVADAG